MRNRIVVINTGPLILLDKIEALDIVGRLPLQFICPPAVREELDAGIAKSKSSINPEWLAVKPLTSPLSPLIKLSIDKGEAEVIQLALENNVPNVCLDDRRGRKFAEALGLKVTGLLGLLGRAKRCNAISHLRPFTDKLIEEGGRYSPKLIQRFLSEFGE